MQGMILAAGLGTRLKPITENIPKAMVEVGNKPMILRVIERFIAAGINDIIINLHHFPDSIRSFVNALDLPGVKISYSDESNMLLDTGGGIKQVSNLFEIKGPLLVHNVDILSDISFNLFNKSHSVSSASATLAVRERKSSRYLVFKEEMELAGWINIKTGEERVREGFELKAEYKKYAFSGIHLINPELFHLFPTDEVFSIINFYLSLPREIKIVGYLQTDGYWLDIGRNLEGLNEAEELLLKY